MKISIIILHFGDLKITQKCIESLYKHEPFSFSLFVINNTDKKFVAKDFSKRKITLINNKRNLGFAGGVNVGIKKALQEKADAVLLLNNDTIIVKPFLQRLSAILYSDKKIGMVGPAIAFKKGNKELFDIGGKVNKLFLRTSHNEVVQIRNKEEHSVDYVSGCCMLIKNDVFKKIGLFDESFFLYYEDADFCLRAKKAEFLVFVIPSVVIGHLLSASAGEMSAVAVHNLLKSAVVFGKKHAHNPLQAITNKLFILFQAMLFTKANPILSVVIAKTLLQVT